MLPTHFKEVYNGLWSHKYIECHTIIIYIYVHIYDLYKVNYKKESKTIEHV